MESFNPNRHIKEQFVSNLTGSSKLEIFLLITNLSILVLIRRCIGFNWISFGYRKKDDNAAGGGKNFEAYVAALLIDFLCIAVPYTLFLTVLAEWTYWSTILLLLLLFILKTFDRNRPSFLQEGGVDSTRENISSYRVSMMLVTCLSILAVDFKIFPRRYAKTETYGTSLMDLGVGSFVVANALVSRQVHVGEYGVHWNFFFTLAAVAILTLIIDVHPKYCGILGSFILIGYQALLSCGLNKYLLSEERKTDIISQNKEGIFSIFGYWGMYLSGVRIGSYAFFGDNADAMLKTNKSARTRVWALCMLFWSLTLVLDWYVEATSRRMCNMAYVSLILAFNLQVLAIVMMFDYVPGCKNSAVEEAFSRNMLASFLLANVLTGLVNLSIDTLSASSISALAIMFVYAFILCFVVGIADFLGIRLKFW